MKDIHRNCVPLDLLIQFFREQGCQGTLPNQVNIHLNRYFNLYNVVSRLLENNLTIWTLF